MKNMTLEQMAAGIGGQLFVPESYEHLKKEVQGVVIDNRNIQPGDLFVPIRGARVDGHTFIPDAFARGAMAVLSDHVLPEVPGPYILVDNTEQALKQLAAYYRRQLDTYVIGIIGSVGKTSTKEMVASVLKEHFTVLKTEGNLNNEIGLPLTLFRIRDCHQVAVVEMGISDFGEMDRLGAMAQPNMVILTNIGLCHLENLKTRDGILQAKTEVFAHMRPDGVVILNGDDDKLRGADTRGMETHFFGRNGQEFFADDVVSGLQEVQMQLHTPTWEQQICIPIAGEHNAYNALAATAAGTILGMSQQEIVHGLANSATISGRNHLIMAHGMTIIDDCYNANPVSMRASLEVLSHAQGRKIAVLGDMGELGADEGRLHYEVGEAVVSYGIDLLFTAGELSRQMAQAIMDHPGTTQVFSYDTKEDLLAELKQQIKKGDTILVKASHFMDYPQIVKAITE